MNEQLLANLILAGGIAQLCVLIASALVPIRLNWRSDLASLSTLHRQLYWVYGGYVVMAIIALGFISIVNATEIAQGGMLARSFCVYVTLFWGVRLSLQAFLDVKEHLTAWWLKAGYRTLTALFAGITVVFGIAALMPRT